MLRAMGANSNKRHQSASSMVLASELAAAILAPLGILSGIFADFRILARSGNEGPLLMEVSWLQRS